MSIRLVVGLGNPGEVYARTRHNVGFWWAERCAAALHIPLALEPRFFALAGRAAVGSVVGSPSGHVSKNQADVVHVLLPQTFMNLSGKAVAALARYYRIDVSEMLVVHDDLDLLPGVARLKQGGGHGGHNGLKDIIAQLGSPGFWRLRLGIGHPGHRDAVASWVLHAPRADEMALIEAGMDRSMAVLSQLLQGDFAAAMQNLHTGEKGS